MTIIDLSEAYNTNTDFKEYVDREARKHRMMPEDILKWAHIMEYYTYLMNRR